MLSIQKTKNSNTIFITSTTTNEGKTFITTNLAASFSLLNKKVLLVEANIRNPKISDYLNLKSEKGLYHFLKDPSLKTKDIVKPYEKYNFDIIEAGDDYDYSTELLNNDRFEELLDYAHANYDLILIEAPAVNVDSDTLMLAHFADLFLYIIRADSLTERMLNVPKALFENQRLPNMNILMNAIDYDQLGYDSGNAIIKKPLWQRLLNKKKTFFKIICFTMY